jgi:hypothetical protein
MKTSYRLISLAIALSLFIVMAMPASVVPQQKTAAPAAATGPKASLPVLITSCGQSPGPDQFKIFLGRLKLDFLYKENATPADLNAKSPAGAPIKTVIIVTGASLKGMGAAGVSVDDIFCDPDYNLRYTSTLNNAFGVIVKDGNYYIKFIPRTTTTVAEQATAKLQMLSDNTVIGSVITFPTSFTKDTPIEFSMGRIIPTKALNVVGYTAITTDLIGMLYLVRKYYD